MKVLLTSRIVNPRDIGRFSNISTFALSTAIRISWKIMENREIFEAELYRISHQFSSTILKCNLRFRKFSIVFTNTALFIMSLKKNFLNLFNDDAVCAVLKSMYFHASALITTRNKEQEIALK